MVSLNSPSVQSGVSAPAFELRGADGKRHSLESVRGPNGTVVMFICNHCPYVKAVIDKIVRDMGGRLPASPVEGACRTAPVRRPVRCEHPHHLGHGPLERAGLGHDPESGRDVHRGDPRGGDPRLPR